MEEKDIAYWYDEANKTIHVRHRSGKKKRIRNRKKIERFLQSQETTLDKCKMVRLGVDRLGLFKRKWFWFTRD